MSRQTAGTARFWISGASLKPAMALGNSKADAGNDQLSIGPAVGPTARLSAVRARGIKTRGSLGWVRWKNSRQAVGGKKEVRGCTPRAGRVARSLHLAAYVTMISICTALGGSAAPPLMEQHEATPATYSCSRNKFLAIPTIDLDAMSGRLRDSMT